MRSDRLMRYLKHGDSLTSILHSSYK